MSEVLCACAMLARITQAVSLARDAASPQILPRHAWNEHLRCDAPFTVQAMPGTETGQDFEWQPCGTGATNDVSDAQHRSGYLHECSMDCNGSYLVFQSGCYSDTRNSDEAIPVHAASNSAKAVAVEDHGAVWSAASVPRARLQTCAACLNCFMRCALV